MEKLFKKTVILILLICINIGCIKNVPIGNGNILNLEIEVEEENYQVYNLSELGNSIEYIALETNENSFIGRAKSLFFENNNFYIEDDRQNVIHRFNRAGKYMGIIGNKGGGPEEYAGSIFFIDIIPEKECISFFTSTFMRYSYKLNGEFIERMKLPKIDEGHFIANVLELNNHLFLCDLASTMQTKYNYLIYNDSLSSITHIEEELHPISKFDDSFSSFDMAITWRYKDQLRYLKYMDNIISSFQINGSKDTLYTIQYGKYRIIKPHLSQNEIVENSINMQFAVETDNYIYLKFNFNKWAPESIKEKRSYPDGTTKIVTVNTVCAVYNKSSHSLQLLKHPIKNSIGLNNDIDGGPPFWPQYISASGNMIMYYSAEKLMEIYNSMESPPDQLKEIMKNVDEESNPIIILVK